MASQIIQAIRKLVNSTKTPEVSMVSAVEKPMAVSIPQLALRTGLSEALLYQKANEGTLPGCRRIGKRFLVHLQTFEDWLKEGTGDLRDPGQSA
jgi:predicted DNA-binding transcriptional regulator AlpA